MSKKYNYPIWYSYSLNKPEGFSNVKKEPLTYTYKVPIFNHNARHQPMIDSITIKCKVKLDTGSLIIDHEYLSNFLKKEIGVDLFETECGHFQRDNGLFPYITEIFIFEKEKYFHHKFMKERKNKLDKIRSKLG